MIVSVRYFAVLRDRAGVPEEKVETSAATVRQLIDELIELRALGVPSPLIRPAVASQFVPDEYRLTEGCEVVLIPPVAGG